MLHPKFPRNALIGGFALGLVALAPVAAQAGDSAMIRKSVAVRVSDLDISKPADAVTLQQRIRRAAAEACSDSIGAGPARSSDPDRDCMASAIANALESVKPSNVTYTEARQP